MSADVTPPPEGVLVLVCGDLADLGGGIDLEALRSSLESQEENVAVEVTPDLCGHPSRLSQAMARRGAARAVLGLCSGDYPQVEFQARARKAGLDPFGVEVVPLGTLCARVHPGPQAVWKAKVLLTAAVARSRAFRDSEPKHSKPYVLSLDQKVSRRSLFTLPPIGYRAVPSIRRELCAAGGGCQLCASVCPRDALRRVGARVLVDKGRCDGCGVCLAACPREAMEFPGWSLAQFEAQLASLLDSDRPASEAVGLLLTCQEAVAKLEELGQRGVSYSHSWLPVTVPCLGMVTPTWVLQALAHGADTVALLSCGADCPFGQSQDIGGRVNFARRLLPLLRQDPDRVRALNIARPEGLLEALRETPSPQKRVEYGGSGERLALGTLDDAFQAIRCLDGEGDGLKGAGMEHPYSPFGVLQFRGEGCTLCLACVESCPTGALETDEGTGGMALTYVASSCNGCGMCVDVCPEGDSQVLRVRRVTQLDAMLAGKVVLHEGGLVLCEGCGAGIASRALLNRIEASLEGSEDSLRAVLGRYCPSCRSTFAWGDLASSVPNSGTLREETT